MTNFVLVPGAWLGAWAWDAVAALLRAEGHGVYPVTLSGARRAAWSGRRSAGACRRHRVGDRGQRPARRRACWATATPGSPSVRRRRGSATGCGGWCTSTRTSRPTGSRSSTAGPTRAAPGSTARLAEIRRFLAAADRRGLRRPGPLGRHDRPDRQPQYAAPRPSDLGAGPPGPPDRAELPTTYIKCLMDGATPSSRSRRATQVTRPGTWSSFPPATGRCSPSPPRWRRSSPGWLIERVQRPLSQPTARSRKRSTSSTS